jgi:hypothetical protein
MGEKESKLPSLDWRSGEPKRRIELTCPFILSTPVLELICQKFNPNTGDILSEEWNVDGKVQVLELPPFACVSNRYAIKFFMLSNL